MRIVRATPEEANALTHIAIKSKQHWGYSEKQMTAWREALTIRPEQIEAGEIHIATLADEIVGFYGLQRGQNALRLDHLWVLPKAMASGVGRQLFTHAVQRARELGFNAMHIESDPNAEGFYTRMGARRIGVNTTKFHGHDRVLPLLIYEVPQIP